MKIEATIVDGRILAKAGPIKGRPGLVLAPSKTNPRQKRWQKAGGPAEPKEGLAEPWYGSVETKKGEKRGLKQLTPQQVVKKLPGLAKWSRQFKNGDDFKMAFLISMEYHQPSKALIYEESIMRRNNLGFKSFWQAAQKAK